MLLHLSNSRALAIMCTVNLLSPSLRGIAAEYEIL